ncbi:hypothetical protein OIDMADRAFT_45760 [Oidiodendron maius Zn]|uniref:NADP-dependent oxidoreductase domain-containing protein n=1 Tax=Oidiodendron maius (strain Zn) TaxID=913774 RepID=A0A0C3GVK9_OIDMZ|nr:hypothetical protein OIDMADRAFT_45760 [Oidiodendron maius Zn]
MTQLPVRILGKNGPLVTAIGLGCMGLGNSYTTKGVTEVERLAFLDKAFELGSTFWVTSDVYGDSEGLIGKWFDRTGNRNKIFLATKFGYVQKNAMAFPELRSDPVFVKEACEKSLKRLGVAKIDLYLAHRVDGKTPIEETIAAMVELKKEGKIGYLGLSEVSSATLKRACTVHHISAVEIEYSPFALDIESEQIKLLQTCRELGVAVIAYSPLGRGMLTGRYTSLHDFDEGDGRRFLPRFSPENFPKNLVLVRDLMAMAANKGCAPSQLTLAWLMAQGLDIIPLPGTTRVKNLKENLGALDVRLTDKEVAEIRKVVEDAEVYGERYPEGFVAETFRDTPPLN